MGDTTNTSRIQYILDAAQIPAEASKVERSFQGVEKAARSAGVEASARLNQTAASAAQARLSMRELENVYANVSRTQGANSEAARTLAAELGRVTTVSKTVSGSAAEIARDFALSAAAAGALGEKNKEAGHSFGDMTKNIVLGQGALSGYEQIIEQIIRSAGGLTVGVALFLPVLNALAPLLLDLISKKEELIALDTEQIEVDARRHASLNTGRLFTVEYARVLRDVTAESISLKQASTALSIARVDEADSLTKTNSGYRAAAEATDDLSQKLAIYVTGLFVGTKSEQAATAARIEATKALDEQIDARIKLAAAMGQTAAALIAERNAAGAATSEIERLTAALNEGALAQARFNQGRGLIGDVRAQVAQEAAAKGELLSHAEAQKRFTAELVKRGEATVKLAQETTLAEKNMKSFDDVHEKHARSQAGAIRAMENALVDLHKRAADSEAALTLDALSLQRFRISAQIQAEREHLAINKRDKVEALNLLDSIERSMLAATIQAAASANVRAQADALRARMRHLEEMRKLEEQHNKILLQMYMDRLQAQDKLDRQDAQSKLSGTAFLREKAEAEIAAIVARNTNEAARAFGRLSRNEELAGRQAQVFARNERVMLGDMEKVNRKLTEQEAALIGVATAMDQFSEDWIRSGAIFQFVADGISQSLAAMVAHGEDFGANMKGVFLDLIAQLAAYFGRLFISIGAGMIFIHPAAGAGLIAAGVALMALSGLFAGLATKAHESARAQVTGGASAGGSSAAIGGGAQESHPGQIIQFPTSGALANREADRQEAIARFGMWGTLPAAAEWIHQMRLRQASMPIGSSSGTQPIVLHAHFDAKGTSKIVIHSLESNGVLTIRQTLSPGTSAAKAIKKASGNG